MPLFLRHGNEEFNFGSGRNLQDSNNDGIPDSNGDDIIACETKNSNGDGIPDHLDDDDDNAGFPDHLDSDHVSLLMPKPKNFESMTDYEGILEIHEDEDGNQIVDFVKGWHAEKDATSEYLYDDEDDTEKDATSEYLYDDIDDTDKGGDGDGKTGECSH